MPRKPTKTTPTTTPTKTAAEKSPRRAGGTGGGTGTGGTPHHTRATAASAARSGSPSPRAMRIGASAATGRNTGSVAGSESGSGSAAGSASVIAAPPRAALGGNGSRTSSPAPAPSGSSDEHRNGPPADTNANTTSTTSTPKEKDAATAPTSTPFSTTTTITTTTISSSEPTQNHTLANIITEKDARIASLERELLLLETEFTRELDKLSKSESETSTFWQAKYSSLNQQFLRTDTELRLLRSEQLLAKEKEELIKHKKQKRDPSSDREREREREKREAETATATAALLQQYKARYEALAVQLRERDAEIAKLQGQIRGLKEWVSTSTRSDGTAQTSDEVFGDGMARLGNGLQNWVLVNFRRAKIDLSKADEQTLQELGRLVPMYEDLASTSKVNLVQSLVSRLMVESVFDAYFVGLSSEQNKQFTQMETFLSSFASSPETINQWRSMTLGILKKEADTKMQKETASILESVMNKVNNLLDGITDTKSTETRDQALRILVGSAIELSRLLVVQRAIFKVSMPEILPHQQTMFDPSTMEDIGGEDEESLEQREICCVTFPGIIKRGDESGGHLQYRNVISKARVLCSPE